jgi:hypothetical protein
MGPFATAILVGCLQGMKYLLWLVAVLLLMLVLAQWLRGESAFKLVLLSFMALLALGGGLVSGRAAATLLTRTPRS